MDSTGILLATTNPAKQDRLRWTLEGLALHPVTPGELGLAIEGPEESGGTHEENARIKALEWSRRVSMPVVATDGGLTIPALGPNWSSLLTHRFAGELADDSARLAGLLKLMEPYKGCNRRASWVEALAVAMEGKVLASWRVEGATGVLLDDPGSGPHVPGFWVFSVWYFPELGKIYNELNDREREGINDHWSQLKHVVQSYFREGVER